MVADNYFLSFLMVSKSIAIVWCGVYNKCVYTLYIICCCVLFLCYGVMALHFRENKSMVFVFWILCVANCSLGVFVGECGYSRNVCNVFILCMLHIHRTKTPFLRLKNHTFVLWICNIHRMNTLRTLHKISTFTHEILHEHSVRRRGPIHRARILA